jgi:hypothetical protein
MSEHEYMLHVACNRMHGRIALNGCTVFRSWQPRPTEHWTKLNPWCLVGDNRLTVEVGAFPADALPEPSDEQDVPGFTLHLFRLPDGVKPASFYLMLRFEWEDNEAPVQSDGTTAKVFDPSFRIARHFGDWCWLDAHPYEDGDRSRVLDAVERVHAALGARDAGVVQGLLAVRRVEVCHALRLEVESVELDEYQFLESFFEQEDWAMDPLDRHGAQLLTEAEGRLVRVTKPNGDMLLTGRGGGRPFVFDIALSHIDDDWLVVR